MLIISVLFSFVWGQVPEHCTGFFLGDDFITRMINNETASSFIDDNVYDYQLEYTFQCFSPTTLDKSYIFNKFAISCYTGSSFDYYIYETSSIYDDEPLLMKAQGQDVSFTCNNYIPSGGDLAKPFGLDPGRYSICIKRNSIIRINTGMEDYTHEYYYSYYYTPPPDEFWSYQIDYGGTLEYGPLSLYFCGEEAVCDPPCNEEYGECGFDNSFTRSQCNCLPGYGGDDCNGKECVGGTYIPENDRCRCDEGWTGEYCENLETFAWGMKSAVFSLTVLLIVSVLLL